MGTETPSPRRTKTRYPGVFRSPSGGYEIMYTDSLGRRRSAAVPGTVKDAQRERAAILERMHQGVKVAPSKITVEELADKYLREATHHLRGRTAEVYEANIRLHIIRLLGRVKVSEMHSGHVAGLVAELRKEGKAAWTIHGVLTVLSGMMKLAVRKGWLSHNPVHRLEKSERPTGFTKPMRVLSSEEIGVLLANSTDHFRPLLMTALFSGLRISELLNLRWKDIDFRGKVIQVRGEVKTHNSLRDVVIPDFLVKELAGLSLLRETEFVFTTLKGKRMDRRQASRGALERTLLRAKVDHCRFHDLRHTFASILVANGEDIVYVANQLGHASPAITLRIYAHLFDAEKRAPAARDRMEEAFKNVAARRNHD